VFKLYDTYGFPPDLTQLMADEAGFSVSLDGFQELMDGQRESSRRAAQVGQMGTDMPDLAGDPEREGAFVGYETLAIAATIGATDPQEGIEEGETGWIVLTETPFYPEGGGQVWDLGTIEAEGLFARVLEVRKSETAGSVIRVEVHKGRLETGISVTASVDRTRRIRVQAHHTATHLLHAALRQVLGSHVRQAGSLVAPDRLRFDFTHYQAVQPEELNAIEEAVNRWVDADLPVHVEEKVSLEDARAAGALAFFGEKYGDAVRVVSIPDVSMELCGGTHMNRTSRVGPFRVTSESSIAAGVRRVEAVSGRALLDRYMLLEQTMNDLSSFLGGTPEEAPARAERLRDRVKELEQELEASKAALHDAKMEGMLEHRVEIRSANVIGGMLSSANRKELRAVADQLRGHKKRTVVVLASRAEDRAHLLVAITDDLVAEGVHAGRIVGSLAEKLGGRGGGRAHLAEAGAKVDEQHAAVLDDLPRLAAEILESEQPA
jgi:alanyl-tRNA synthetase